MRDFDNSSETGNTGVAKDRAQDAAQSPMSIEPKPPTPNLDMLARGIVVGVSVSVIIHAGKKAVGTLVKNPVVVFGLGFAVGLLAHRHRKKIIALADNAAGQGKAFVLRQQENLNGLFAGADETPAE